MAVSSCVILLVGLFSLPVRVRAVSLDGILIYTTDGVGNPVGFNWDTVKWKPGIRLWHTRSHSLWFGLAVLPGLLPASFKSAPINAGDFTISIPLHEGENDFTLLGATGEGDAFQAIAFDLFFDGGFEYPGISVLVPANSPLTGVPPMPNQSDMVFSLSAEVVSATPEVTYTDGTTTISVSVASFLLPSQPLVRNNPFLLPDPSRNLTAVSPHSLQGESTDDWIGTLSLLVETNEPAAAPLPQAPQPFTGPVRGAGAVLVGPDISGRPASAASERFSETQRADARAREVERSGDPLAGTPGPETAEPTEAPTQAPTADSTTTAVTPTPGSKATTSPTGVLHRTITPAATPVPSTPTGRVPPSGAPTKIAPDVSVTPSAATPSKRQM